MGDKIDTSSLKNVVMEWIEVLDKDQSGYISFQEFYIFFANLGDSALNDLEITSLYHLFDTNGDNGISAQEFALALLNAFDSKDKAHKHWKFKYSQ
mgnify:CR=1 FL=1